VSPSAAELHHEDDIQALRERMKALLRAGERRIVVDLAGVKRLTSVALSFLFPGLAAGHRKEAEGVYANLSPEVQQALEASRLLQIVHYSPTLEEALAYFDRPDAPPRAV